MAVLLLVLAERLGDEIVPGLVATVGSVVTVDVEASVSL